MLKNKTILLGITGGIAAYKICELIRMYKKAGAKVKVVATHNALNFVTALTLETLSGNKVYIEQFKINEYKPEHISLTDESDIMVIAPLSANTLSKIAVGICDNLLTSIACAYKKQIIIAPAMNTGMWENIAIQENLKKLQLRGMKILEPETGFLACGTDGKGRLCSLDKIFNATEESFKKSQKLKGKHIVITAGGTIEKIDPVRYISNFSSGKMGIALADTAYSMGANVTLISTVDIKKEYNVVKVNSALEMRNEVKKYNNSDCVIMAAAVADYRVENYSEEKIKKTDENEIILKMTKNPDILKEISSEFKNVKIVGFCAESQNLLENAKTKIINKGCDFLIANDISRDDIGFSSDENEVYILDKDGNIFHIEKKSKTLIAQKILEKIFE